MNTFSILLLFSLVLCLNAESRFLPSDPGCDDPSICVNQNPFANSVNPATYCVCTVAGPPSHTPFNIHLMPCAGGTCFNSNSGNCDSLSCEATPVGCDDPSICVNENAFANAVDPTSYCVCTAAGPASPNAFNIHLMPCAGGTCFNSASGNCDSASCEETAPIPNGPLWVPNIAPLSVGNCPSNAPNSFDCGSYIGCDASGNAIVQLCPKGQSFDGSNCVWWTPNCPADAVCAEGGDIFYSFGQEADGFEFDCSYAPDNYFVATYLLSFTQYFACKDQVVALFYCCSGYSYAVADDHEAYCQ